MQSLTASEARANLHRILDETAATHEPIMISGKRSSAIQETLYLLALLGMRESVEAGTAVPLAKSAEALKW